MSDIKLTPEQLEATVNSGGQLLVSAAAGSGKTKVLVERLLNYIENGHDVDEFLIITYTNAAAAELRGKIMDALYERIAADPENRRLRREANLCGRASIETIHSFCAGVIRENAHTLGLSPDFRIADETESRLIMQETLDELLEELYDSGDDEFYTLADTMGAGRDDSALVSVVLDTHTKLLSHPDPEKWVSKQLDELNMHDITDVSETVWGELLMKKASDSAAYWEGRIDGVLDEALCSPDFERAYGDSLRVTKESLRRFREALGGTWNKARDASNIEFPRPKSVSGYDELKAVRLQCKKELEKTAEIFCDSSEKALEDMHLTAPAVSALLKLVLRFDEAYSVKKRRRGVLDFSDQEHLALKLLADIESGTPTKTACDISGRFCEIMVDEYQDVNEIQEMIFGAVSKGGENIFMVGDVKQSIYRFRLADPTIFLRKYLTFKDAKDAAPGEGRKLVLSKNFRSREEILDAANFIFKNVMSSKFGDMDYTEREYLYAGASYPDTGEPPVELDVIDMRRDDDDEQKTDKTDVEALFAARRIKELIGTSEVSDGAGGKRPARYGDIAILMRSPKSRMPNWLTALSSMGIPVAAETSSDFFSEIEISIMLSLMSVIDNPHQDIPLISVLRSPIYGFTTDDLAWIRLGDKDSDYFTALLKSAENSEKSAAFLKELELFREAAPDMSTDQLLWYICNRTGFFAIVSAMPGGEKRRANLMRLFECARKFESSGFKGLFGFVTYVRRLIEQGDAPAFESPAAAENAVTIMSIHKSKGLEFPIVILADMTHRFNTDDAKKPLLIHPELGVGPKRVDLSRKIEYPTIARRAVKEKMLSESLSEELRVLYVAMTRAREKLIMLCTFSDAEHEIARLSAAPLPVPPQLLLNCKCSADWVLMPALRRAESAPIRFDRENVPCESFGEPWDMRLICGEKHETDIDIHKTAEELEIPPQDDLSLIAEKLDFVYPYLGAISMPSKVTATELKGTFRFEEAAEEAKPLQNTLGSRPSIRPEFMEGKRGLTAAQKGTAAHIVMQFADYTECLTETGAADEIERLRNCGTITDEQADAVSPRLITGFFSTEPGKIILEAQKLWRELKFSILVDSGELLTMQKGEQVLLQGVVDCCALVNGKLVIIDFKTDYVSDKSIDERAAYYAGQLDAYALAMERMLKLPVDRKILCFLTAGLYKVL